MDALKALRDLIVQETQIDEGKIISIDEDGKFFISTKLGIQTVTGDTSLFEVGNFVKVVNGVITFKTSVEDNLTVHER